MAKPRISHERLLELLDYDPVTGVFRWRIARPKCVVGGPAGCLNTDGYLVIRLDDVLYYGHRIAIFYVTGQWPVGVDHRLGNRGSAKLSDLREAGQRENGFNKKLSKKNTSGFKGASYCRQRAKWRAQIEANRKHYEIGYFDTPEEAHLSYKEWAIKLHGEFANFG